MGKKFSLILDIPKSLFFNIKCFGFGVAIKMPVIISHRVKVKGLYKGAIVLNCAARPGLIRLGMSDGAYQCGESIKSHLCFSKNSHIYVEGEVHIANSFAINMCENSSLILGDNFSSNYGLIISCAKSILFKRNCLLGWSCTFIDSDGHDILDENEKKSNYPEPITIGEHVWIASNVTCLKGSEVASNSIVGYGSVISRKFVEENILITGAPAKTVKHSVGWRH